MKTAASIIAIALTLFSGSLSWGIEKRLLDAAGVQELNEEAPEFALAAEAGKRISLKEMRGKVVLLHIWATWCAPCKEEFPLFAKVYRSFKDRALVLLPVAIDKSATHEELASQAKKLGAVFPVYLASEGSITERYWTWGVPVTYFIDKRGWIRGRAIGPRDWSSDGVYALIKTMIEEK